MMRDYSSFDQTASARENTSPASTQAEEERLAMLEKEMRKEIDQAKSGPEADFAVRRVLSNALPKENFNLRIHYGKNGTVTFKSSIRHGSSQKPILITRRFD